MGYGTGSSWFKQEGDTGFDRNLVEAVKTAIRVGYRHIDGAEG